MQQALTFLPAFLVGAIVTAYLSTNSLAAGKVDAETPVNLSYFLMAALGSFLLLLLRDGKPGFEQFTALPWYAFVTGLLATGALLFTTKLIGSLGPDKFFVCSVAGQLICSVTLAHFGWLGSDQEPVDWQKVLGLLLAIGGAVLVSFKFE